MAVNSLSQNRLVMLLPCSCQHRPSGSSAVAGTTAAVKLEGAVARAAVAPVSGLARVPGRKTLVAVDTWYTYGPALLHLLAVTHMF